MRRLLSAVERLAMPLRLRYIDHKSACSQKELQRLSEMRADLVHLERVENFNLVRLGMQREQIEKGHA